MEHLITRNMTFKERILARKAAREAAEAEAEAQEQAARVEKAAKYGMTPENYDKHIIELCHNQVRQLRELARKQ